MEERNKAGLEQFSTRQLDELLGEALRQEPPDGNTVRRILGILKEREADVPTEHTPAIDEAWEEYRAHTGSRKRRPGGLGALKAASIVLAVCALVSVLSQNAEAESFFQRLARWTDSIFELFDPDNAADREEYVFRTDNPGLQQVYDSLTDLGVTEPVVPMWLPEGYELVECKTMESRSKNEVYAAFSDGGNEFVFKVNIYTENIAVEYNKNLSAVDEYEINGTVHSIMRNNDLWVVVWLKDNLECSITVDCQEDILYEMLRSVYFMEDK